jgi:hypothetical protein
MLNPHRRGVGMAFACLTPVLPQQAASGHPVLAIDALYYGGGRMQPSKQLHRRPSMIARLGSEALFTPGTARGSLQSAIRLRPGSPEHQGIDLSVCPHGVRTLLSVSRGRP